LFDSLIAEMAPLSIVRKSDSFAAVSITTRSLKYEPKKLIENQICIIDEENHVEIEGIVTREPEAGKDEGVDLIEFSLVNRRFLFAGENDAWIDDSIYLDAEAWDNVAKSVMGKIEKGAKLRVVDRIAQTFKPKTDYKIDIDNAIRGRHHIRETFESGCDCANQSRYILTATHSITILASE